MGQIHKDLSERSLHVRTAQDVAESVERNVKSYSEMLSSAQSSKPALSQLTTASIKRVFRDAVQEKEEASANLIVFGLSEEGEQDLKNKLSELFSWNVLCFYVCVLVQ